MKKQTTCGICKTTNAVDFDADIVRCPHCNAVATWLNTRTGEVWDWKSDVAYYDACRNLQDQMDAAFDNQYFGDSGW